jgi:hypothetical protein
MNEDSTESKRSDSISEIEGIPSEGTFGHPAIITSYPHWQYFLALERDFVETTYFVEPVKPNFDTFSVAYARILLSAGSEIDVLCKLICRQISPASKAEKIDGYRKEIMSRYPRFPFMRILVPRHALVLEPWIAWSEEKTPEWWQLHQKVKHERNTYYHAANLTNSIHAVAALFCLVLYYYQPALYARQLQPWAQFFRLEQEPGHLMKAQNYKLPDF